MKIMYIVYSFTTGGTEKLLVDICNEMVKRDNEVFLYVVNDYYTDEMLNLLNNKVHIELEKRKIGDKNILKTMNKISRFIKKNNIETIHCNSFDSPELLFVSKLFNHKIKIFYTIHGMNQYKSLNKIRKIYRNIFCDKIIAISNSVKKDILDNGAKTNRTVTIYNSIETNKFSPSNARKFNKKEPIIGNVARIVPQIKGQDILISAIANLKEIFPNIKCYFAGSVSKNEEDSLLKLKEQVIKNELEDNIFFVGNIKEVNLFLEKIDIFVLPSKMEGFGLSLIEAMCAGVPVIASNIAGPAEIINNEGYGKLFKSEDSEDLAIKIKEIIENYDDEKTTAWKNADKIKSKYDIKTMCNSLEKVYGGGK